MDLKIGDKVAVLDDDLEGKIVDIGSQFITIVSQDGFEMDFPPSALVKIEGSLDDIFEDHDVNYDQVLQEKDIPKKPKSQKTTFKERLIPPMEVDLHINKLVNKSRGMSNHDMLNLQMDTARRQLEFAFKKRIQRIVFIHGVGEGVLKAELDFLLGRYNNLKYYDADYQKYGLGATEVYIFQNP